MNIPKTLEGVNQLSKSPIYFFFFLISIISLGMLFFFVYAFVNISKGQKSSETASKSAIVLTTKIAGFIMESEKRTIDKLLSMQREGHLQFKNSENYFKLEHQERKLISKKIYDNTEEIKYKIQEIESKVNSIAKK